jgi:hypothetical protein
MGDFKTLDISDLKTAANFTLLAAKFGIEPRKCAIISGQESRNCDGHLLEFHHFGYEVCDLIGKMDVKPLKVQNTMHSSSN